MRTYRGTDADPVILDPWKRIKEVHWDSGSYAVLEITAPEGLIFHFGAYSSTGTLHDTFTKDDITNAVMDIFFENPTLDELYNETTAAYLIGTVVFPSRIPPDPFAYEVIKASIHPPNRFVEPTDLRTLGHNEFPYQITGWPTDGNWANPAFPWGTWAGTGGRPGYLTPPISEGVYETNWGLGEAYQESTVKRSARKYAYMLDFTTQEDRIGNGTVALSIFNPSHDDHLPAYSMQLLLKYYSIGAVFHVSGNTVTATKPLPSTDNLPPFRTQTRHADYDQAGTIASITRAGFI